MDSLPGQVSENTRGFYEHRCRAYPIPGLGSVRLNAEYLDGLYRDLCRGKGTPSGKPLAPSTVGHVHATARAAEPPRAEKKERPTLDLDGLGRFFEAANGERLEALWIVWCLTGLRPGEMLDLEWQDVRLNDSGTASSSSGAPGPRPGPGRTCARRPRRARAGPSPSCRKPPPL